MEQLNKTYTHFVHTDEMGQTAIYKPPLAYPARDDDSFAKLLSLDNSTLSKSRKIFQVYFL